MLNVVTINESLYDRYSAYVAKKEQARFGHDLEWATVLRETYGVTINHLVALEDSKVVGICPLFLCKPILGGAHYETSLFPSYFGPLYDTEKVLHKLLDEIERQASTVEYAEIIAPDPLPADERLPYLEQLDLTYRLSLNHTPEHVYGNFRRNYKRILRNPKFMEDVELIVDTDGSQVREFYRLYIDLYARKHGFIPHTEKLFHRIFSHYQNGMARIYMARHKGKYIGGIFTFWKYGEIYCGWSAQDTKTEYYPMHFLIWKIMQDGIAEGFHWFNHGEAPRDNENLKLFKAGWNMKASDTYRYFIPGQLPHPIVRLYDRYSWSKKLITYLPTPITSKFISPLIRFFL